MSKELEALMVEFYEAFNKARESRSAVLEYLEEHTEVDHWDLNSIVEDDCEWCYGLDWDSVEELETEGLKGEVDDRCMFHI